MRLVFVLSLLVGLVALLTLTHRLPLDGRPQASGIAHDTVAGSQGAGSVRGSVSAARSPLPTPPVKGQIYRWRDAQGSIHFQTDPPPAGVQADVITFVRPSANTVRIDELPQSAAAAADIVGSLPGAQSVYTPEGFDELIKRVEETAVRLRDRNGYIEALAKQL